MIGRILFALALLVGLATGAAPAFSHAVLIETVPADGSRLEAAPREVILRFNEPVAPIVFTLLDGSGTAVPPPAPPSVTDTLVRMPVPEGLRSGSYVVSYRVTSGDSHPVGGAFVFAIGQPGSTADAMRLVRTDATQWQILGVVLRVLIYAGLLAAAGGALFDMSVAPVPPGLRRRLGGLAAIAALAGVASVGVQGGLLVNPPLSGLLGAEVWRVGMASTRGFSMLLSVPGLLLLVAALRWGRGGRLGQALGVGLSLAGFLVTGHAATANPVWLTAPAMAVHAATVAFWVGSLAPLVAILAAGTTRDAAVAVTRFSRIAVVAVAALLIAGLALAIVQVVEPNALPATEYGLIFSAKLAFVAGLLLLALYNKWRLTPALERGEPGAGTRLRRAIAVEMAVIAVIFVATASLGAVPPPRTMAGEYHLHFFASHSHPHGANRRDPGAPEEAVSSKGHKVRVEVNNGANNGSHVLRVAMSGPGGDMLQPLEVIAAISNDSAGVAAITRKLAAAGPGTFELQDAPFPFAGIWTIDIDALISDFEKASWSVDVEVK